jgi:hypothetical protein
MQTKQNRSHSPVRTAVERKPFFSQQNNFFPAATIARSVSGTPGIQKQGTNETGNTRPRAVPLTPRALPPLQAPLRDNEGPGPAINIPQHNIDMATSEFIHCYSNSRLAQRMILHYSQGGGATFHLNAEQMEATNPFIQLQTSDQFHRLRAAGPGERNVQFAGLARALTLGTLGAFTVNYNGRLTVSENGDWNFTGSMYWQDRFDFDPRPLGIQPFDRSPRGEQEVRIASAFLRGRPYSITSDVVNVRQSRSDYCATYLRFSPSNQPVTIPFNAFCRFWLDTYNYFRP